MQLSRSPGPPTDFAWRPLCAGLAAGYAVVCNYPAVFGVVLLTCYAVVTYRRVKPLLAFLAGGAVMAILLCAYHAACFGNPLTNANAYQNPQFAEKGRKLLFGMISLPDPWIAIKLMFGSYRGLFFSSPVLLMGFYGMWEMAARRRLRAEAAVCLLSFIAFLLFNASFNGWHGGMTFGPRYLIPAIPFLALPLALAWSRFRFVLRPLALLSAFAMSLGAIVTPLASETNQNPVWTYLYPIAFDHPTGGDFNRFKGPVSAWPAGYQGVRVPDETWNSFNLGEYLWPQSLLSTIPLLIWVLAGTAAVLFLAFERRSVPQIE